MKTLSKEAAIAMVQSLADAAVKHYQSINEKSRKSPVASARRETLAARRIISFLTAEAVTDAEIKESLG